MVADRSGGGGAEQLVVADRSGGGESEASWWWLTGRGWGRTVSQQPDHTSGTQPRPAPAKL